VGAFSDIKVFGTGLALTMVRREDEFSEDRNSILGSGGPNWNKPIGSYGSASRRFEAGILDRIKTCVSLTIAKFEMVHG